MKGNLRPSGPHTTKKAKRVEDKNRSQLGGYVQVVADHKEEDISLKRERAAIALEYAPFGVAFIGSDGLPQLLNRQFCRWFNRSLQQLKNTSVSNLIHEEDRSLFDQAVRKVLASGQVYQDVEIRLISQSGMTRWASLNMSRIHDGKELFVMAQFTDISKRKLAEEELVRMATCDHLTSLANRKVFEENLKKALKNARRYNRRGAVLYIDLNDFKNINDMFGHKAGDAILVEVAQVLEHSLREGDTIARLGGDEFAVIMEETAPEEAYRKAQIVEDAVENIKVVAHGKQVGVSVSVGVKVFSGSDISSMEDVVAAADKAMYDKKAARRKLHA